ncbi:alpha/beta fold hydrolase [uncultured Ilumatobacter sp.]|jgi:pimeloyl-ACP methyl ester carboxylesterase|uniref:alpha/beta fold hydrolase n=1 Tax=uncultured Ilumatobacter sp. TaxID=879968 RepID=UPI00374F2A57
MASVVLVHGWGGAFSTTWQRSGFTALLADGGKHVIAVDLLGHGQAPKPHDPEAYTDLTERIFDAIDAESPDEPVEAVGFSLGALTLLSAAIARPERFSRIVLAGIGHNVIERDHVGATRIVEGLELVIEAEDADTDPDLDEMDQIARLFVQYAQQPGNDIRALAAVMRRPPADDFERSDLATVTCPVLVIVGDRDFVHPGDELASRFPDGRCETLKNVDHFATPEAFGFFDATLEFLDAI